MLEALVGCDLKYIRPYYLLSPLLQVAHGLFVLVVVGIVVSIVVVTVVVVSIIVVSIIVVAIGVRSSRKKGEGVVTSEGGETVVGECLETVGE